jgi:LCP family protein required for cell wall assembly
VSNALVPPRSRQELQGLPPELSPRGPQRHRSRLGRLGLVGAALLSVLVLAVSAGGWFLYNQFASNVKRDSNWHPAGNRPTAVAGDENILLLGDDSRDGTGDEYGGKQVEGIRSDTTIIAHFDKNGTATLLSFPRDELIPVLPRVKGTPADGKDKLTNILTYAGVSGLTSTLESLTGLHIDHYVTIDLAGFKQIVDAVGGVTVCVSRMPDGSTTNLNDDWSQWHGHLGENTLNGDQALAFVRTRHALGDERLRILRQQQFLSKLLARTTAAGTLTNPAKVVQLLGAVGGAMTMDSGLGQTELVNLADRSSKLGAGKVRFITIPTHVPLPSEGASDDKGAMGYHGDVLLVNVDELQQILAPLRPAPPQDEAIASAPPVAPAQVTVAQVLNASGRAGLAVKTRASLAALGFGGPMTASSATTDQTATEVHYPPGQEGAAKALLAKIPGARAVPDATATTGVKIVLGSSFSTVTGTAATAGTASAAATTPAAGSASSAAPTTAAPTTAAPGTGGIPADTSCTP